MNTRQDSSSLTDSIFRDAVEIKDECVRKQYLERACGGDVELRQKVEELLANDDPNFLKISDDTSSSWIGRSIGKFRIERLLGIGGMGWVYLAQDGGLERKVALKILPKTCALDQERKKRFIREARLAAKITHRNVATIYDSGVSDGLLYIAMEYVEGSTLASKIKQGPLNSPEIARIGSRIAAGLAAVHRQNIVHRDIKPGNIMFTREGEVKILDFGVATREPTGSHTAITEVPNTGQGVVLGTYRYMSPEQVLGRKVDRRSDVFSLGVTLYEMATSQAAFEGTPYEIAQQVQHAQPDRLSELEAREPRLGAIVRKCLKKDLPDRYQSALDVQQHLEDLKVESRSHNSRRRSSRKLLMTLGSLTVIFVCFLAFSVLRQHGATSVMVQTEKSQSRIKIDNDQPGDKGHRLRVSDELPDESAVDLKTGAKKANVERDTTIQLVPHPVDSTNRTVSTPEGRSLPLLAPKDIENIHSEGAYYKFKMREFPFRAGDYKPKLQQIAERLWQDNRYENEAAKETALIYRLYAATMLFERPSNILRTTLPEQYQAAIPWLKSSVHLGGGGSDSDDLAAASQYLSDIAYGRVARFSGEDLLKNLFRVVLVDASPIDVQSQSQEFLKLLIGIAPASQDAEYLAKYRLGNCTIEDILRLKQTLLNGQFPDKDVGGNRLFVKLENGNTKVRYIFNEPEISVFDWDVNSKTDLLEATSEPAKLLMKTGC